MRVWRAFESSDNARRAPGSPMSWTRLAAAVVLALQLLLAGGAEFAHAQHDAGGGHRDTHVESGDHGPCAEHHSHLQCPLCRSSGDRARPVVDAALLPFLPTTRAEPVRIPRAPPAPPPVRTPSLPRAPPRG